MSLIINYVVMIIVLFAVCSFLFVGFSTCKDMNFYINRANFIR